MWKREDRKEKSLSLHYTPILLKERGVHGIAHSLSPILLSLFFVSLSLSQKAQQASDVDEGRQRGRAGPAHD
jgi:hypothetical protein